MQFARTRVVDSGHVGQLGQEHSAAGCKRTGACCQRSAGDWPQQYSGTAQRLLGLCTGCNQQLVTVLQSFHLFPSLTRLECAQASAINAAANSVITLEPGSAAGAPPDAGRAAQRVQEAAEPYGAHA